MRLVYAPQAAAELDDLLAYIAERSPSGAHHVAVRIKAVERILIESPNLGRMTTAREPPVRRFVVTPYPYVVFYEVHPREIVVIGVRHAARDPASMPGADY